MAVEQPTQRAVPALVHRDLARAISAAENGYGSQEDALRSLRAAAGTPVRTYVVGVTGPPGAGKSTLVDRLIEGYRAAGETVAVIAVDPSSPFTHGAVLGDRVRMQRHAADRGVFIRSMASREAGGGLAPATREAISLVEAAGFDVAIVETVGVGQVEIEVVSIADVVAVVTVPALGDSVQTIKAGLTEIADIFVVNMADRPGANRTSVDLKHMVRESGRDVPVVQTIANEGTGLAELMGALATCRADVTANVKRAVRFEVVRRVRDRAVRQALELLDSPAAAAVFERLESRQLARPEAAQVLLKLVREGVDHAD